MLFARVAVVNRAADFARVDVEAVLPFLGETKSRKIVKQFNNLSLIARAYFMLNVTMSSMTLCCTYLDNFFSSSPFLCKVAMKSVSGRDILNCVSRTRPAKMSGS